MHRNDFAHSSDDSPALVIFYEARRYMDANKLDQAVMAFEKSAALEPHYKTLQLLGECLLRLGRAREAIIPLAAATGLNRQPMAPMLLAEAFIAIGDLSDAESAASRAIDNAPNDKRAIALLERVMKARQAELKRLGFGD